ncbi:MAG: hypothetical protein ACI4RI_03495 [Ruminococcus sp.]
MEKEYGQLAVKYNTLKEELFKSAFQHPNNKSLLRLIKDTGLFWEYTCYCIIKKEKSAEERPFQQRI